MADVQHKMSLERARQIAEVIAKTLRPGCDRIEIAGSIRREKPEVGDIEIVAIPHLSYDLCGQPDGGTFLNQILGRLEDEKRLHCLKGGNKYRQYVVLKANCKLDLFLVEAATWGCQLVIRTGPAEFSRRLVTLQSQGGLCQAGLRFEHGRLVRESNLGRQAELLDTREESDVFRELGLAWIEPRDR